VSFRSDNDTLNKVGLLPTLGGIHRFVPCGAAVAAEATAVGDELWGGLSSLLRPHNCIIIIIIKPNFNHLKRVSHPLPMPTMFGRHPSMRL